MRKRNLLLAAGACLASLSLTMGTALADPPTGTFRDLAGTGSDTTQDVLNGLAGDITGVTGITIGGNKVIASYNATGTASIQTKATGCSFTRPAGSGQGVDALVAHTADGCLQFARSSANDSASRTGANLTYIPFAVDALGYVTRVGSGVPKALTVANLTTVYNCSGPAGGANPTIKPVLPHFGSGTRKFFLAQLGFTDAANFVSTAGHTCIRDQSVTNPGVGVEENDGTELTDPKEVVPYSVAQFIAETRGIEVADRHGSTLLRNISGVAPVQLNTDAIMHRDVYNVVPNAQIGAGTETNQVFVGPTSLVCTNTDTIKRFGFAPNGSCGSTAIQTP